MVQLGVRPLGPIWPDEFVQVEDPARPQRSTHGDAEPFQVFDVMRGVVGEDHVERPLRKVRVLQVGDVVLDLVGHAGLGGEPPGLSMRSLREVDAVQPLADPEPDQRAFQVAVAAAERQRARNGEAPAFL